MNNLDRHLHIDAVGGIAGDMFVAAALDLMPDLLEEAIRLSATIGPGVGLELLSTKDHGLAGKRLKLSLPNSERGPKHYPDYVAYLVEAAPSSEVASRACDILKRLGEAEAAVHGVPLEKVHFHEISDWDSIADILLAAWLLDRLHVRTASVGPLPIGSGRTKTEHGIIPLPAPATLKLLQGLPLFDDGIQGERITPTGAAILAHLEPKSNSGKMNQLMCSGHGFGTKKFEEIANLLRLSLFETSSKNNADQIGVINFHIDDQTPEDLAVALENLRSRQDVLDVLQMPAFGKKGRMTTRIELLCQADALEDVSNACFLETTTIGLRLSREDRLLLHRDQELVTLGRGSISVKRAQRPDGRSSFKPENDGIARAGDRGAREELRADVAAFLNNKTKL